MGAIQQVTVPSRTSAEINAMDIGGLTALCAISHESDTRHYEVVLAADISSISLEGMNHFQINIHSTHKVSGLTEKLQTILQINIREEMNCVSIDADEPLYFSITRRSLDLLNDDIDSSIHEVVDIGLMELRIRSGSTSGRNRTSLLFDMVAANFIKAGVSTLLAQSTQCHRQVIHDAGHLFARRQDYVREMCRCLNGNADSMVASLTGKLMFCDQGYI